MNWYKKSQLEQTLPYFQEFEDMGEYVPNEQSVNDILENQFNTSIVKDIGQGDSGVAYLLANGDILKITTNKQEGQVADYFSNNPSPHVVKYKLVWKEGDLYYIIMDKIETMADTSPYLVEVFDYIDKLMIVNKCFNPECSYSIIEQDDSLDTRIKKEILSYILDLTKTNISMYDFLNINNMGIKDGRLVFFDIT
jgi:hypothetical protein